MLKTYRSLFSIFNKTCGLPDSTPAHGRIRSRLTLGLSTCLSLFMLNSCAMLLHYTPVEKYPVKSDPKAVAPEPKLIDYRNNPDLLAEYSLSIMACSDDKLLVVISRALSRLPDLNDSLTVKEAEALRTIFHIAEKADQPMRNLLLSLIVKDNDQALDRYSGPLQGLFWMVQNGDFDVKYLSRYDRDTFLDYAWRELPKRIQSPQDVLDYLASNYAYLPNRFSVQRKKKFFAGKRGDCTEFTLLGGYLLDKLGYQVYALFTRPTPMGGHVSIIFGQGRQLYLLDGSRISLNRILRNKAAHGGLKYADAKVWDEIRHFDRIFGPKESPAELVANYEVGKTRHVSYRIVPYKDFEKYIESNGRERSAWYRFQ